MSNFASVEQKIMRDLRADQITENYARALRGAWFIQQYAPVMFGSEEDQKDTHMVASDLIADILHATEVFGDCEPMSVLARAERGFKGDSEDGPYREDDFDEFVPTDDMKDAWERYQRGEDILPYELRELDDQRATWALERGES